MILGYGYVYLNKYGLISSIQTEIAAMVNVKSLFCRVLLG